MVMNIYKKKYDSSLPLGFRSHMWQGVAHGLARDFGPWEGIARDGAIHCKNNMREMNARGGSHRWGGSRGRADLYFFLYLFITILPYYFK
jgi:uncharacterized protein with NRDE domain